MGLDRGFVPWVVFFLGQALACGEEVLQGIGFLSIIAQKMEQMSKCDYVNL
jgi:hypothetical protein